jgi:hypothetical protein
VKIIKGVPMPRALREGSLASRVDALEVGEAVVFEPDRSLAAGMTIASRANKLGIKRFAFRLVSPESLGLSSEERETYVRECGQVATIWRVK